MEAAILDLIGIRGRAAKNAGIGPQENQQIPGFMGLDYRKGIAHISR